MYKCYLTGINLDKKTAYVLDPKIAIELSKTLLERYNELKKLSDEYGKVQSIKRIRFGKFFTIRRRKIICEMIAETYNSLFSNNELFIPLKDYLAKQESQFAALEIFDKRKKGKEK
ncbi:MAG: hypothetical protein M0P71_03665 [Melioribacteraceae bacterium]|nr:hypothetical protein [Melioribacteraceae bacterium]